LHNSLRFLDEALRRHGTGKRSLHRARTGFEKENLQVGMGKRHRFGVLEVKRVDFIPKLNGNGKNAGERRSEEARVIQARFL